MTRLEKIYKDEVTPALMKRFGYQNPMQVPRISKITLNMGVGEAAANKKVLENATADMAKIARALQLGDVRREVIAGRQMDNGENRDADEDQRRDHDQDAVDDVAEHITAPSVPPRRSRRRLAGRTRTRRACRCRTARRDPS